MLGRNSVWNEDNFSIYRRYVNVKEIADKLVGFKFVKKTNKPLFEGLELIDNQSEINIVEPSYQEISLLPTGNNNGITIVKTFSIADNALTIKCKEPESDIEQFVAQVWKKVK